MTPLGFRSGQHWKLKEAGNRNLLICEHRLGVPLKYLSSGSDVVMKAGNTGNNFPSGGAPGRRVLKSRGYPPGYQACHSFAFLGLTVDGSDISGRAGFILPEFSERFRAIHCTSNAPKRCAQLFILPSVVPQMRIGMITRSLLTSRHCSSRRMG